MNFEVPDIRANNAKRNTTRDTLIAPAPPDMSDTEGMARYISFLQKTTVKGNRENLGVAREVDILLQVLDDIEPDRKMQKQLIKEAAKKVPLSDWLRLQLIKKYEEECIAAAKQKAKEEKKAKKNQEAPGQLSIMDEPGIKEE